MAWLEIHQTLPVHKKTLAAADALDMPPAHFMGHIITFWLWALDNVPDGDLYGVTARMIARAAQWEGDPDTFLNTLVDVGFIDREGDDLSIHDWYDYAGKLMEQRAKERERSKKRRAEEKRKRKENDRGSTAGRPEDDRRKTVGTVQYSTVPNSTINKDICAPDDAQADEPQETKPRSPFKSMVQEERFDAFWSHYPRKRSKGQAERAWAKITPDAELFQAILDGLGRAKESDDWNKDNGQFIPYPATWLNSKGWEDEYKRGGGGSSDKWDAVYA